MPVARRDLIDLSDPGWIHCTNRCVRRAFLCGVDQYSGNDYEHRKTWVDERLGVISRAFAVDIAAYAVMSNHIHLLCRMRPEDLLTLSHDNLVDRYLLAFPGFHQPCPSSPAPIGDSQTQIHQAKTASLRQRLLYDPAKLTQIRERLGNLSWLMAALTQPIARWSNQEDEVTGRFWEGRFRSDPILDHQGLLACMAYIDLNPIRAGLAERIEDSDFTSGQQRFRAEEHRRRINIADTTSAAARLPLLAPLSRITAYDTATKASELRELEYLRILEFTGRQMRSDKRHCISDAVPSLLARIATPAEQWTQLMVRPGSFRGSIGTPASRQQAAIRRGKKFVRTSCHLLK